MYGNLPKCWHAKYSISIPLLLFCEEHHLQRSRPTFLSSWACCCSTTSSCFYISHWKATLSRCSSYVATGMVSNSIGQWMCDCQGSGGVLCRGETSTLQAFLSKPNRAVLGDSNPRSFISDLLKGSFLAFLWAWWCCKKIPLILYWRLQPIIQWDPNVPRTIMAIAFTVMLGTSSSFTCLSPLSLDLRLQLR